eukprot:gene30108-36013_t
MRRYSYVFEEKLDNKKKYILVEFPHGAFPIAQILGGTLVQTMFPQAPVYSIAASAVFYIPTMFPQAPVYSIAASAVFYIPVLK